MNALPRVATVATTGLALMTAGQALAGSPDSTLWLTATGLASAVAVGSSVRARRNSKTADSSAENEASADTEPAHSE